MQILDGKRCGNEIRNRPSTTPLLQSNNPSLLHFRCWKIRQTILIFNFLHFFGYPFHVLYLSQIPIQFCCLFLIFTFFHCEVLYRQGLYTSPGTRIPIILSPSHPSKKYQWSLQRHTLPTQTSNSFSIPLFHNWLPQTHSRLAKYCIVCPNKLFHLFDLHHTHGLQSPIFISYRPPPQDYLALPCNISRRGRDQLYMDIVVAWTQLEFPKTMMCQMPRERLHYWKGI